MALVLEGRFRQYPFITHGDLMGNIHSMIHGVEKDVHVIEMNMMYTVTGGFQGTYRSELYETPNGIAHVTCQDTLPVNGKLRESNETVVSFGGTFGCQITLTGKLSEQDEENSLGRKVNDYLRTRGMEVKQYKK